MRVLRKDLLTRLLCLEPGINHRGKSPEQTWCVAFANGRAYSLSVEIACSVPSGIPAPFWCAVRAERLIAVLRHLPEEELDVTLDGDSLKLRGKGGRRRATLAVEPEVLLPYNAVTLPDPKAWRPLDPRFGEAVELVCPCAVRKGAYLKECVHLTPDFLEACDGKQLGRYVLPTPAAGSVLVYARALAQTAQLGFTQAGETEDWLHFRSPPTIGLRLSVRKYPTDKYPDMSRVLTGAGQPVTFPAGLKDASTVASLFNKESVQASAEQFTYVTVLQTPDEE
jgi:hypothetical protein